MPYIRSNYNVPTDCPLSNTPNGFAKCKLATEGKKKRIFYNKNSFIFISHVFLMLVKHWTV